MKFDNRAKALVPIKLDENVRLEISLNQPLDSADQAYAILGHVFAFSEEDFLASVPELWRSYLAGSVESNSGDGKILFKQPMSTKFPPAKSDSSSPAVYRVGNGVTAPKPVHTPDPEYSEAASKARLSGTALFRAIIDKTGAVRSITLNRPLGLGLDEMSIQKIMTWKFEPAMRNGEPVAVEMNVEVMFHLQ